MFGYLMHNEQDQSQYQRYYCGLCHTIKKRYGNIPRLALNHDLTFLAILLTSLYEGKEEVRNIRCVLHPLQLKEIVDSKYLDYASDMTILLTLFKLEDDVLDEPSLKSKIAYRYFQSCFKDKASFYQEKYTKIASALNEIHQLEASKSTDLDALCALSGAFLAEVFAYQKDEWYSYLYTIGDKLGRFIYLLDAYDDLEEDKKRNRFNPLISYESRTDFEAWMKENLTMLIADAAQQIERLPLFEHLDIIENVIYKGVWTAYQRTYEKRNGEQNERSL